jgi:hypothetical protein
MEDVRRLARQAGGAGILAGPEPDGPARDDSAWDDLRSADPVAVLPEAALCKRGADRFAAQSCAVLEPGDAGAGLTVSARELAARQAELYWPAPQKEMMALGPPDLPVARAWPQAALQEVHLQPEQPAWEPLAE